MKRPGLPRTVLERNLQTDLGMTLMRFAVPLMAVLALVWLGYQF